MTAVKKIERVLITAGGTGGHVFPALAAARLFQEYGVEVCWVGTRQGIEADIVRTNDIRMEFLDVAGVRGQGLARLIWAPLKIVKSVMQVIGIVRRYQPDLVLGMGGFVTGPTGVGVWLCRRPVFIHEQNAVAGFTNKMLSRFARKVFQAFPSAFPAGADVETTGNPVRREIVAIDPPALRYEQREGPLRILVLGGSQGAVALNELVPEALARLQSDVEFLVRHQCGAKNIEAASQHYLQSNVDADVVPFIDDMAAAYAWADVVICRSGALTVSELAAAGVASVLIPYPYAVDDHQTKNGEYLSFAGAAVLIQQQGLNAAALAALLKQQLKSREKLKSMAEKARALAMTDATEKLVQRCMEMA
ncbi:MULTISPECIES: undecaprenyldiphospho-muramoylpentapeptide beta-N-acetylglucosaminyltransferase [unclassified Ketobacter]|uniref:undecaprenyldiphospho-muramoylpentapeptide beta-N-acetylglucosaminyltransferase n=1 Tax=unclassified Ketobacter TaxID=2639109 RepID=UPI000F15BF84|nr:MULTISPECIES: undecaprenyldiphospho-muramoylpentapeptide beta-N-acetylglucosaminyltransferase [unclassified Ketobacter]MCK5790306.1 undecaprenyldiphospho-muramoylpentapeptide beta-N-acetylglucosaminyltransferase [Ketobacter sp.]RLT91379.1 MAG: undecaprenyldiphospho-muramoylpentapeptide beta-N-acetylglucosaminyltransferase [Ketobacter sp. GenoA1]RLT98187.1 MAG: undecaprenyldiphospho-muramoylpentapeptide beta-N-acetylglucosaminyltransferase [Ketobacter sp.]